MAGRLRPAERRVAVGVVVAALLAAGLVGPRGADAADPPTPVVYVAFSHNFPDALTGSVAAALDCAPLLLVPKDPPLPEATRAELQRLQPGRIVILGGEGVVSTAMQTELGSYTTPAGNVDRLFGPDRFGTAADISQALAERACDADTLDGLDSAAFWQKSEAVDAATLDGLDAAAFWQKSEDVDAATLDGLDATAFERAGQGTIPVFPPAMAKIGGAATMIEAPLSISLPEGATDSSFSFGFTLPDDYVAGDPVTVDVVWGIPESGCDIMLLDVLDIGIDAFPRTYRARPGAVPEAGELDGLGVLPAPSPFVLPTVTTLTVDMLALQPGDTVTSTIYRYADDSADTCTEDVSIYGVVARYGS